MNLYMRIISRLYEVKRFLFCENIDINMKEILIQCSPRSLTTNYYYTIINNLITILYVGTCTM